MKPAIKFLDELESKFLEGKSDVISLIKADHRKVDALFLAFTEMSEPDDKATILEEILTELFVHLTIEEKLVYSLLDSQDHEGTNESFVEHHSVEKLLEELKQMDICDDMVNAKVKVMSELVKHHVKEEESQMLPLLKKTDADLDEVGEKFKDQKEALKEKLLHANPKTSMKSKARKAS